MGKLSTSQIQPRHIEKALELLAMGGWPKKYDATKFALLFKGKRVPPKAVLYRAAELAGLPQPLTPKDFSGGFQTNDFLIASGFEVVDQEGRPVWPSQHQLTAHSWRLLGDTSAEKTLDLSSFLYDGTGIPKNILPFFSYGEDSPKTVPIRLFCEGAAHDAYLQRGENGRVRMFWRGSFSGLLKTSFPGELAAYKSKGKAGHNHRLLLTRDPKASDTFIAKFVPQSDAQRQHERGLPATDRLQPKLNLYDDYSRQEIHSIFAPRERFSKSGGPWGLQGIAEIPDRTGDFVFFVTYGSKQARHKFDEGITRDGVLTWQSQQRQHLAHEWVAQWKKHDELSNNIFLFLRTAKKGPYTFLGKLKYLRHDSTRERPVHFQWQLLDWAIPEEVATAIGLEWDTAADSATDITPPALPGTLVRTEIPPRSEQSGVPTPKFQGRKAPDYSQQDANNRALGAAGERLVLRMEKECLERNNLPDLAAKVRLASEAVGDGLGYDIESFDHDGTPIFIEVKTTRGARSTAFYMSANERNYARMKKGAYRLYRVYGFDDHKESGEYYVVTDLEAELRFVPTAFRVSR